MPSSLPPSSSPSMSRQSSTTGGVSFRTTGRDSATHSENRSSIAPLGTQENPVLINRIARPSNDPPELSSFKQKRARTSSDTEDSDHNSKFRSKKKKKKANKKNRKSDTSESDSESEGDSDKDLEDGRRQKKKAGKKGKKSKKTKRVRQQDFKAPNEAEDPNTKLIAEIITIASPDFRARMMTTDPFADDDITRAEALAAITRACKTLAISATIEAEDDLLTVLKDSLTSLRGRIKTRIRSLVDDHYNFSSRLASAKANQKLAAGLLEGSNFTCKKYYPDKASGPYRSEVVQRGIEECFFRDAKDLGIKYSNYFNPIPVEVIALVCGTINWCLIQYQSDGIRGDAKFTRSEARPFWQAHLEMIHSYRTAQGRAFHTLQDKMYQLSKESCKIVETKSIEVAKLPQALLTEAYVSDDE